MRHTSSRTNRLKRVSTALLMVLVFAQGCANLAAIREFAEISTESAQYTRLVVDYAESPAPDRRHAATAECSQRVDNRSRRSCAG